jgi:hypothetical protein
MKKSWIDVTYLFVTLKIPASREFAFDGVLIVNESTRSTQAITSKI